MTVYTVIVARRSRACCCLALGSVVSLNIAVPDFSDLCRQVLHTTVAICASNWAKLIAGDPSVSRRLCTFASAAAERLAGATGSRSRASSEGASSVNVSDFHASATDDRRATKEAIRDRIWQLYAGLKAYRTAPTAAAKAALAVCFEGNFTTKTGFVTLDRLLARLNAKAADLLMVLERPDIPLHTNGSERDILPALALIVVPFCRRTSHDRAESNQ